MSDLIREKHNPFYGTITPRERVVTMVIIIAAMLGTLAGFLACMFCKETYDTDLVEWDNLTNLTTE